MVSVTSPAFKDNARTALADPQLQRALSGGLGFTELRRAKKRVKRLERQLRGEPVQPEDSSYVPEYLRVQ